MRSAATFLAWAVSAAGMFAFAAAFLGFVPSEFAYLAPAVVASALMISVAFFVMRKPGHGAARTVLAGVGVMCLGVLLPDIRIGAALAGARPQPALKPFTLVELNVWDRNKNPQATIDWLRSTNADIIVLEEARHTFVPGLLTTLGDYTTAVTCESRPYCGTVILSKFKGTMVPGGRWVADGFDHPFGKLEGMGLAAVRLDVPDGQGGVQPLTVVGVHLDRERIAGVNDRQIDDFLGAVNAAGGRGGDVLVAGDFNTSAWSPQLRRFAEAAGMARISAFAATWPSGWRLPGGFLAPPLLPIDHVYLGCSLTPLKLAVGPDVGSDHRPLMAEAYLTTKTQEACSDKDGRAQAG